MSSRARYIAELAEVITDAGEQLTALHDRPVAPIPGTPSIQVFPGNPYVENAGPRMWLVRLEATCYAARLDQENAMDTVERFLPLMREAATRADLRFASAQVITSTIAGVDYVVGRVFLQGEQSTPDI